MSSPRVTALLSLMLSALLPTGCSDSTPPNAGDFEPGAPGARVSLLAQHGQEIQSTPAPTGRSA